MPYSSFQYFFNYLHYIFTSYGKHHVHSPFVFEFITQVLEDCKPKSDYNTIEKIRKDFLKNERQIEILDLGAGSRKMKSPTRKIKDITRYNLKPQKYAQLIYRIIQHYQSQNILELGTSLGITTSYMALANSNSKITTIEGSETIFEIAKSSFQKLPINNINTILGSFDKVLPEILPKLGSLDLVFIDGNHTEKATQQYFSWVMPYMSQFGIIIFDDIHWSPSMEKAWQKIQSHPETRVSIDLFFMGIVFLNTNLSQEKFKIRF